MFKPQFGVGQMGFALLLLGLVPLMLMGDMFFGSSDDTSADEADPAGHGGSHVTGTGDILQPNTDDPEPFDPNMIDPATIITPNDADSEPFIPNDVDPDTFLNPVDEPGEDYVGGGSALQQLIAEQSDFSIGLGHFNAFVDDTDDYALDDEEDLFALQEDGIDGTGEGLLSSFDGTPILISGAPVGVVDAGAGDDGILAGDGALYAFGGAGDDTMVAGDGATAFFGGTGDDLLIGGTSDAFFDGGDGNDVIVGGVGDDVLSGGSHAAGGDLVQDNDVIDGGAGDDDIRGGFGADVLRGGDGDDVIDHLGRVEQDVSWGQRQFAWHIDGAADSLAGGAGDDTLIMDCNDTAVGGEGMDSFIVYYDEEQGTSFADIGDFETGLDFLRVELNPDLDYDGMEISVNPSADGQDGVVMLNDEVVAVLRGAADATLADVLFSVTPNLAG